MKLNAKKVSLRRSLAGIMVICWVIPVMTIAVFMTMSYRDSIIATTEKNMQNSLKNFTSVVSGKLDELISIAKRVSYEQNIEHVWKEYKAGLKTQSALFPEIKATLNARFHNDKRFSMSCFFLSENPDQMYYTARAEGAFKYYKENLHAEAVKISGMDSSDVHIRQINEKIYMIRNLYTTANYTKFATLVVEVSRQALFEQLDRDRVLNMAFFIDDADCYTALDEAVKGEQKKPILSQITRTYSGKENYKMKYMSANGYEGYLYERKFRDYHMGAFAIGNTSVMYKELDSLYTVIVLIFIFMLPVLGAIVVFLNRHIARPIHSIIEASREMEEGNIGVQIEEGDMPNEEFAYMKDSFNRMSREVKDLFDYAYSEKLARKDAKIMALQSQINPHFLNNTLEMMNWQARMAGDIKVSKMIEALGTLLDYSMDRSNRKMISLYEEMRCTEAYFYITSMRFGQRLKIERDIDESLLQVKIPELILQPILENAVTHGVEEIKQGTISLKVFRDGNEVCLEVTNSSRRLKDEELERIRRILDGSYTPDEGERGRHVSVGIRNVNERIKLIYGEEYGLTITQVDGEKILSSIRIPIEFEADDEDKKDDFCSDLFNIANINK